MEDSDLEIPVRLNRCIRLRQMHSSIKGNLSVVVQHHKAEGSSRVSGLNKAIMRNLQRELHAWYREQSILLEKMNRYQNSAYEKWIRIEKMKELTQLRSEKSQDFHKMKDEATDDKKVEMEGIQISIQKTKAEIGAQQNQPTGEKDLKEAQHKKLVRSSSNSSLKRPQISRENSRGSIKIVENKGKERDKKEEKKQDENKAVTAIDVQDALSKIQTGIPDVEEGEDAEKKSRGSANADTDTDDQAENCKSFFTKTEKVNSESKVAITAPTKNHTLAEHFNRDTRSARRLFSGKEKPDLDPVPEDMNTADASHIALPETPVPPTRASKTPTLPLTPSLKPARSNTSVSLSTSVRTISQTDNGTSNECPTTADKVETPKKTNRPTNRPQMVRSATFAESSMNRRRPSLMQRPGTDFKALASRQSLPKLTGSSFDENFTCWKKEKDGNFVAVTTPYTRRKFRSPKKRDPKVLEWMLQKEGSIQSNNQNKFKSLCAEIDTLENFNPLQEVKKMFPEFYTKKKAGVAATKEKEDTLFRLMQAFGAVDKFILDGLDPNSPEALKMCRYLRLKNGDGMKEEKIFDEGKSVHSSTSNRTLKLTSDELDARIKLDLPLKPRP